MPEGSQPEERQDLGGPGRRDAEAVRKAAAAPGGSERTRGRGRPARTNAPPAPPAIPGEDPQLWGEQIQGIWNKIAELRHYDPIPDRAVSKIGIPAALVAEKWGAAASTKYPELLLLGAMAPYLFTAAIVEWRNYQEQRARKEKARTDGQHPRTQGPAPVPRPGDGQRGPVFEGTEINIEGEGE